MKIIFRIIFIIFFSSFVFSGCNEKSKNINFRIGFNTWVGYGPFYIAKEKGFFQDEGLNVDLIRIEGTGDRRAALIGNRIEALGSTVDDFVIGLSQGLNGKMVLMVDASQGGDGIIVKQNINSVKDFKNKKIGVQPGFVSHFFLLSLLDKYGIPADSVTIVALEPDAAAAAIYNNEIDVAVTWEPNLSAVKNHTNYKLLLTTKDSIARDIIVDNLIVRDDIDDEKIRKVNRAWFRAISYMQTNREDALAIISKNFSLEKGELSNMLSGVHFPSLQENKVFFEKKALDLAKDAQRLYTQSQIINGTPYNLQNLNTRITASYLGEEDK